MKNREMVDAATIPLSSPTGSSSVMVYHDCQKVASRMYYVNVCALENGSQSSKDALQQATRPDGRDTKSSASPISQDCRDSTKDEEALKNSLWTFDSGPEDNSTDPHETMTETSTLTFVDLHTMDDLGGYHSLQGVTVVNLKEFVLIDDDDDDGDMSLREKTVTDWSIMDGNAADLVCGRLFSTSSGSVSECKQEPPASAAPPPEEHQTASTKQRCCFCTVL